MSLHQRALRLLRRWGRFAEAHWYDLPDRLGQGCFGTGFDAWGVQTNQKYIASIAPLALSDAPEDQADREHYLSRALSALRFSLASHQSGSSRLTDGGEWGRTWISALGIERMMHAVDALTEHLTDEDHAALRRMIFADGRLARIGGDTRARYCYCQDYLIPALLYAADVHRDLHALDLLDGQLTWMEREADENPDGGLISHRLGHLHERSPYYYTRLESDRSCALAQLVAYAPLVDRPTPPRESFDRSVAGGWWDADHGDVLHRGDRRLASFSWRAHDLATGLCLATDGSDLAEWTHNLGGRVRFLEHIYPGHRGRPNRRLVDYRIEPFSGGFLTYGTLIEGAEIELAEGWVARTDWTWIGMGCG